MTISVLGTGYVGLTSAAIFAAVGHKTYIVDINQSRLQTVKEGRSFFYEEGLDKLVSKGIKEALLLPTDDYALAIPESSLIFSAVGTPDKPDGSTDLSAIFAAAREAAKHLKDGAIYIQKSTVPVGTGIQVEELLKQSGKHISYISNPEFLREGSALHDSLWFDRVVIGGSDDTAKEKIIGLYRDIQSKQALIAELSELTASRKSSTENYITTSLNSAELIKVSANAFLAMKISFANSIAKLADMTGADINEVMSAVGADRRIGTAFLNAGRGYGGGCFPKDVSGLISSGRQHGVDLEIMQAVEVVNNSMPGYIAEKLLIALGGSFEDKRITVLGLAFKNGTSDARRSPGVALANDIARRGAHVTVFDPKATKEARPDLRPDVNVADSFEEAIEQRDAVLIATDWPLFTDYPPESYAKQLANGKILVDCMNKCNSGHARSAGLRYIGVGRS